MNKIKLYRIMSNEEEKMFKDGILTFEVPDSTYRDVKVNTFDYGDDVSCNLAYRKHFFLTMEDAYKYKRSCGIKRDLVHVFSFLEEMIIRNLGVGRYVYGKFCFEVAIPCNEILELLDAQPLNELKPFENILCDMSNFYIGKEILIDSTESLPYKKFSESLKDILLKFEDDGKLNLNYASRYFDVDENKKLLIKKVKTFF